MKLPPSPLPPSPEGKGGGDQAFTLFEPKMLWGAHVFLFLLLFFLIKFGPQFSASILDYKPISVSLFIRICAITHPNVANPTIVDNGAIY